ncbi:Hypothetical protein LUCI_2644 [Lucifera butyrica]|uniref:Uncharacterized protein n=1 Tax=Lucifera butyrica TaxID=1351585 RepID=A0A498R882_9FIRM|nr:hypothetical protein [Lucifera butyrica]VBB07399.1 Hypothetical protein LUCI_2644 [Lucifera butyrica]
MNWLTKKSMIGLALGMFVLAGVVSPLSTQAAERNGFNQPIHEHHQIDPDKVAQQMADTFGVNKNDVLKYEKQGVRIPELYRASFLAKASGKSLQEVLEAKNLANTWKETAQTLGVTKEQIRAAHQDIAANRLEKNLSIPKQDSLALMQQGYRSRDIAVANQLAKNTSKSMSSILSMRQINNTWHDVAQNLGVDDSTFKQDMKNIRAAFPHRLFHDRVEHPIAN